MKHGTAFVTVMLGVMVTLLILFPLTFLRPLNTLKNHVMLQIILYNSFLKFKEYSNKTFVYFPVSYIDFTLYYLIIHYTLYTGAIKSLLLLENHVKH